MRRLLLALALLACAAGGAAAQIPPGPFGPQLGGIGSVCPGVGALCRSIPAPPPFVGPGDVSATWYFWGGLRAFNQATVGTRAANVCNAGSANCADVNTLSNGNFDVATAQGAPLNCGSTGGQCTIQILYDKSGNGRDLSQATEAERPQLTFSALGTLPCMTFVAGTLPATPGRFLQGPITLTATAVPFSFSTVLKITGNDGTNPIILGDAGSAGTTKQEVLYNGSTTTFLLEDNNSGGFSATTGAAVFHALNAVSNGASSSIAIDGSTTSGTNGTAGIQNGDGLAIGDPNASNRDLAGILCEAGMTNTAMAGGTITSLNSNQHAYWGF